MILHFSYAYFQNRRYYFFSEPSHFFFRDREHYFRPNGDTVKDTMDQLVDRYVLAIFVFRCISLLQTLFEDNDIASRNNHIRAEEHYLARSNRKA